MLATNKPVADVDSGRKLGRLPSSIDGSAGCAPDTDLVDQEVVRVDPSFATARLTAPLHLRLGTQDKSDRCAVFATAPFSSGALDLGLRPFFVCRVTAYDAILGLPFLKDTGMLVGWGAFTVARTGPSQPVAQDTHEWDRAVTIAPILSGSAIGCNHPGFSPTTRSSASSHTTRCLMSSTIRRSTISLIRSTNTIGCLTREIF
ncbi:BZ3500_MvSof-1268-A1-R1_C085g00467 [Microbotryum saponariae]|uniref:BZ3500_MvSof-1268-A1-R1_C085g00467 protein n=1 Tax=Microbotryum saponariae TaxID=289078 RepID=A0A2X0N8C4_9BASI|nr:BZ3500_MvSof-1268-A1-R1_C085g00467 [Microbotryum saponariae]